MHKSPFLSGLLVPFWRALSKADSILISFSQSFVGGHQVDARSWSHSSARDPTFNPRLSSTIHWSPLTCPPVLRSRFFTVDSVTQLYPLNQLFAPQVYSPTSLPCCVPEGVSLGNGSHGLLCWLASRWLLLMGTSNAWRKGKNETRYLFPWHAPSEVT